MANDTQNEKYDLEFSVEVIELVLSVAWTDKKFFIELCVKLDSIGLYTLQL